MSHAKVLYRWGGGTQGYPPPPPPDLLFPTPKILPFDVVMFHSVMVQLHHFCWLEGLKRPSEKVYTLQLSHLMREGAHLPTAPPPPPVAVYAAHSIIPPPSPRPKILYKTLHTQIWTEQCTYRDKINILSDSSKSLLTHWLEQNTIHRKEHNFYNHKSINSIPPPLDGHHPHHMSDLHPSPACITERINLWQKEPRYYIYKIYISLSWWACSEYHKHWAEIKYARIYRRLQHQNVRNTVGHQLSEC